jgi:branched-chain amino acid transport system ATP-binding protein
MPASVRPLLQVKRLTKHFGGVTANHGIELELMPGETHAVIGPNGAGKTTLVAQLSGEIFPSAGAIVLDGADITRMPPHRRAASGLARVFQVTSIFKDFSTLENVALAAQGHVGHSYAFWKRVHEERNLNTRAREALRQVGLDSKCDDPAKNLSHGEHRQLEIAMALVARPRLLLLDEPTAGMGSEESQQFLQILLELKKTCTILLIEHDMQVVFAIADRITVLAGGQVIASGRPDEIQASAQVREAYLGEDFAMTAHSA